MNCPDFKELIPERVAGELPPERKQEMEAHELACPACHQAVEEWRQMESLIRSSWPAEDPRRSFLLPVPPRRVRWLDTARTWFGLASMATVTACLLLLLVLRPGIQYDRGQLSVNFAPHRTEPAVSSVQAATQAQVQAWVQEALAQAATQTPERMTEVSAPKPAGVTAEQANRVAQLAVQIELLKENQLSLWQEVQQHGLYLQSSWHPASDQMNLYPKNPSSRP